MVVAYATAKNFVLLSSTSVIEQISTFELAVAPAISSNLLLHGWKSVGYEPTIERAQTLPNPLISAQA
jgi:hypothetical protein